MNSSEPSAILIADLGYGDAGKGSITDYLARVLPVHTVVRYNGGAQAAHHVVTPDGRQHVFAQFGSATFVPGVRTHLTRFMILHPLAMLSEERHLQMLGVRDAFARLTIDADALVTTPFQQAANRLKEIARGAGRHGSCGMGVGETMADGLDLGSEALFARDLSDRRTMIRKLRRLREVRTAQSEELFARLESAGVKPDDPAVRSEWRILADAQMVEITADLFAHFAGQVKVVAGGEFSRVLEQPGVTLFEGAQGVLLDEWFGFAPYNSWSTLTYQNADTLLSEHNYQGEALRLGLIRGYATRHGAGPFVSEDAMLTERLPDTHNVDNPWQQQFRVGYLDLVALRYAVKVTGRVDGLVVSNLDRMENILEWKLCYAYDYAGSAGHLAGFFDAQNQRVQDITIPNDPTDLNRMEQRTHLLEAMKPVYTTHERVRENYLAEISRSLGVPVMITSFGPTADEKVRMG